MAFDAFLKIDGVPGESTDDAHKDWIEILSFSHGLSQPASAAPSTGGARTAERVDHHDFTIVKALDKASPKIYLACCNGEHIPKVSIEICRAGGDKQKYMEFLMSDVIISSVSPGGSSEGEETLPLEEVDFNYGKIEWNYTLLDHKTGKPQGNVSSHWDLTLNKGG
jgi:type VI secretion system secreted protein Hcp